jgi:hypothetical protein
MGRRLCSPDAMPVLLLKLTLTPILIAAATLAGRRWGPAVGGWLVALPLTSGPVAFFLVLDQGASFAAAATVGSLLGAAAEAAFALAYTRTASRGWFAALVAGSLAFAVIALAVGFVSALPPVLVFLAVVAALAATLRIMPPRSRSPLRPPSWGLRSAACWRPTRSSRRCWRCSPSATSVSPPPSTSCAAWSWG